VTAAPNKTLNKFLLINHILLCQIKRVILLKKPFVHQRHQR